MSVSSLAIANVFLGLAENNSRPLTNMQVQKLVFIAQGFTLGLLNRQLYYHNTHAWQWGPVVPKLYKALQKYGNGVVTEPLPSKDTLPPENKDEMEIIKAVWKNYGHLSGGQLSTLTHKENTPWSITWERDQFGVIPEALIAKHYKEIVE